MVAGLVIVLGFAFMGSLSPADPVAVEETTTTSTTIEEVDPPIDPESFTVAQIAQGEPLAWESAMILDDSYPIALFDHEGWIYLFSTEGPNFDAYEQGGLRGWRSEDGASWETLGQLIGEGHAIRQVAPTGQGLVAVEFRTGGTGFALWQSANGVDWTADEVSAEGLGPGEGLSPMAAGGSDVVMVVATHTYFDVYDRLRQRLSEQGGADLDLASLGWNVEVVGEDVEFAVYGPLGFPLLVLTAEDLGLSPDEVEAVIADSRGRDPRAVIWARTGEAGWQETEIPGASSIEAIRDTGDGGVMAFGYGRNGFTTWSSTDGLDWVQAEAFQGPYRIDDWRGRLVGPSDTGRATVVAMAEDDSWEDIGPSEHFPNEFDWSISATGAGPAGVVAAIIGWDMNAFSQVELGDPPQLTSQGATLTLDLSAGSYSLETAEGTNYRWSMSEATPEGISVDMEAAAMVFHDPDSGRVLASFPIEDLAEAQNSYWGGRSFTAPHRAFAFTPDGSDWTIQDGKAIGEGIEVMFLEVTETHVVAAGINSEAVFDPNLSPGLGVWSAPIP